MQAVPSQESALSMAVRSITSSVSSPVNLSSKSFSGLNSKPLFSLAFGSCHKPKYKVSFLIRGMGSSASSPKPDSAQGPSLSLSLSLHTRAYIWVYVYRIGFKRISHCVYGSLHCVMQRSARKILAHLVMRSGRSGLQHNNFTSHGKRVLRGLLLGIVLFIFVFLYSCIYLVL